MRWRTRLLTASCVLMLCGCQFGGDHRQIAHSAGPSVAPSNFTRAALAARAAHTATSLADGSVLVAGGCNVDGCVSATSSALVLTAGGTMNVAAMERARDAHTAIRLPSGRVLVAGGFAGEGRPPLASAELYDPSTRTWTGTRGMALGRGGHAAARIGDGRIVEVGGWIAPQRYTATTEIYDADSNTFQAGPALLAAADGLAAITLTDGSVLITGGQVRPGTATARAALLSRDGEVMREVGQLRQARFKHTMVRLPTGQVLVIGGTTDDRTILASTEIYDPQTRRFSVGPEMTAGRYKLTDSAAALPDGRVVVGGGGPGLEVIDLRERVSKVVEGSVAYSAFSSVSVVGDNVRVIGGYDHDIRLTNTDLTIPLGRLR